MALALYSGAFGARLCRGGGLNPFPLVPTLPLLPLACAIRMRPACAWARQQSWQHVEEVCVGDLVHAVDLVQAPDGTVVSGFGGSTKGGLSLKCQGQALALEVMDVGFGSFRHSLGE